MTDPNEKPGPGREKANKVKGPTRKDGTNWEENQRSDEEGNEFDPHDIK